LSVLVEALCLVIPRTALELRYPSGTNGFLAELARPSRESRYSCADAHLICVSFLTPDAADRVAELLTNGGMRESASEEFQEFAIVDQKHGPVLQCPWLMWLAAPEGYTCAWLAGTDRGEMAAPEGWTVEQSRRLTRLDLPDASPDVLKLAEENGVETWLSYRTGRIIQRASKKSLES
jgi:hypothetical protein